MTPGSADHPPSPEEGDANDEHNPRDHADQPDHADAPDHPDDDEVAERPTTLGPSPRSKRLAGLVLLAGLLLALLLGRRAMPRDRGITLRLPPNRASIRSVRLTVTTVAELREELTSNEWRFGATGPDKPTLRAQVSLVDGPHEFELVVQREAASETRITQKIDVADADLTIAVPAR